MTITACIVQARLGSSRLPAKILLPLPTDRTVLEEVLWRCDQIKGVDVVVAAIPDTPENDILVRFIPPFAMIVRGSEHDVLARYAKAAKAVNADVVMRVTSDCPLIDPDVCGQVLDTYRKFKSHYCSNVHPRSWPQGFDCEVFPAELLHRANEEVAQVGCPPREHVTPYIRDPLAGNKIHNVAHSGENRSHLQWSLDTRGDYVRVWNTLEKAA
jgi:spore coat polysaccharide biosynthesis protein SpsF